MEDHGVTDVAQDCFDLFLKTQERAREEHAEATCVKEKAYWQGVKDGLRKCYAIFTQNPKWETIGRSSNFYPDHERI